MHLSELKLNNFRQFNQFEFEPHSRFNFIYGDNGSGKTSLLEAVYLLTQGKSFLGQHQQIIQHDAKCLTLTGKLYRLDSQARLGLRRCHQSQGDLIKINGEVCRRLSDLVEIVPVLVVHPESYLLVSGQPNLRRKFLDWGLFHVKPNYLSLWKKHQRLLLQRNSCLKSGQIDGLDVFESYWVEVSVKLTEYRQAYVKNLEEILNQILEKLDFFTLVELKFKPGWKQELSLQQVLDNQRTRDIQFKQTQSGPHRANFEIKINEQPAKGYLSRGQQKILVVALMMAQLEILVSENNKRAIVLIDDLSSELDVNNQKFLLSYLERQQHQVFISSIEETLIFKSFADASKSLYLS